ncbi:MAG: hypothetical protein JWP97_2682 [Labilithrix sp.]|nr:hypothetical protein [Labilithrix sp.]
MLYRSIAACGEMVSCAPDMRDPRFRRAARLALTLGAALSIEKTAAAAPCDALDGEDNTVPILYVENGDTQEPLLKRLGKQLIQTAGKKLRIVYRNRPTCELAANYFGARDLAPVTAPAARPVRYIPGDPSFDPTGAAAPPTCDPPLTSGAYPRVDLAIGATFLSGCGALPARPADVSVIDGPNQAYGFIVPKTSAEAAITAEEGYLAFGFAGANGMAAPWIDQALRFTRGPTASTTLTTSASLGLTAAQMVAGSSNAAGTATSVLVLSAVQSAPSVQAAIGAVGGDLYDANRDKVKMLAFKAFQQRYAYFPDSTSTSFDKQNVRDGHYTVWSPTPYLYVHVPGTDVPATTDVKRLVDLVFGHTAEPDVNGLGSVALSGLVPQCAMKVKRAFDGGQLSLHAPDEPCGCFYEQSVPSGATACAPCADDGVCGGGTCRFGYCEAR